MPATDTHVATTARTDDADIVVQLFGVTQRFGGVRAVNEVDLTVRAGTVHGLIGPNGAGKTTLFDAVSGLRSPSAGRIVLEGRDVTNWSAARRARHGVRRTFQRQQPIGWLTSADNVHAALDWRGGGGGTVADLLYLPTRRRIDRRRRETVDEALAFCGLESLANERAGQLPIGQARLVELARAVVDNPRLLLLDEPTSGLGEAEAAVTLSVIERVRGLGAAILLVEHDMPFVMSVCDTITVLELGSVIAEGTPQEIQANEAVQAAYLG